jgi:hypothetical protein
VRPRVVAALRASGAPLAAGDSDMDEDKEDRPRR